MERDGMEMVEDNFFKLFVNLLLFTKDDITFTLDRGVLELGILKYVADDINGNWDVLAETLGVVNGLFT